MSCIKFLIKQSFIYLCLCLLIVSPPILSAQSFDNFSAQKDRNQPQTEVNNFIQNTWTWIGGNQTGNQQSVYGPQGVASSLNQPGARTFGITWTDSAGVMWLFGGAGIDKDGNSGQLNDLWKYDGQNWTWVGGSQLANQKSNYGTLSTTSPTNWPGARYNAATWYVDGVLWMFGGFGVDNNSNSGHLNDLWKWDGTNWTWMGNGITNNQSGIYGTKGTPDFNNLPGSRISTNRWVDSSGNMWMYGGEGYDENGNFGRLNDLWRLESFGRWTWVSGSKTINSIGNFGTKNVTAATNQPSARTAAATWLGQNNVFYLFGGFGFDKDGNLNNLNDLWTFDGSNWTWINGSDSVNTAGVYGTLNVPSETNYPGARRWPAYVQVSTNEVYLFGGGGVAASTDTGWLNDLWKWDGQNWTWIDGASSINSVPNFGEKFISNTANRPGARDASTFWLDAEKNLLVLGGYAITLGVPVYSLNSANDHWKYTLQEERSIKLTFTPSNGNIASGKTVQISSSQTNTTIYYTTDGSTPTTSSAVYNTPLTINSTTTIKALGVKTGFNSSIVTTGIFTVQPTITEYTTAKGQFTWVAGNDSLNLPASYKNQLALSQLEIEPELIELIEEGSNDIPENVAKELAARAIKANHGTKGIASASNTPGSRNLSLSWTDEKGILWLFGGLGINPDLTTGRFNDLWSFDGQFWTWVGGSNLSNQAGIYGIKNNPSTANWPGGRSSPSLIRNGRDEIYIFGGLGFDTNGSFGSLNDLWKWDGLAWTWISGANTVNQAGIYNTKGITSSTSTPGARYATTLGTYENGDLWLFGGVGYDKDGANNMLNDLWKWDGSNWTWLAGTNVINSAAVYGTKTVADSLNTPSARQFMQGWTDKNDAVWLFGGRGFDIASNQGDLNDIWKWDGTNWTWMAGENTRYAADNYGTKGQAAPTNAPSARNQYSITQDNNGVVWLFGGNSNDGITSFRTNTLWKWDGLNWTWVAGSNTKNQQAIFGTKGQPNVDNQPSARSTSHISFDAKNNQIWIHGGFNQNGSFGRLNDLWVYEPLDADLIKPVAITVNELTSSVSQVILASETPGLSIYYTLDGSTPTSSSSLYTLPFTLSETIIIKAVGLQNNNVSTVLSEARVIINPVPSTLQTVENQWTWFGGSNTANASGVYKIQATPSLDRPLSEQGDVQLYGDETVLLNAQKGIYGEIGVKDASNIPGARIGAGTWKDSDGNVWLFGGSGIDSEGNNGYLNDLWVYDGSFWTWMGGSKIRNQKVSLGVKGSPLVNNWPGGMEIPIISQDSNGRIFLFGGFTVDSSNNFSRSNILWMWDGQNWTWLSGSISSNGLPNYGSQAVTVSSNMPGARSIAATWVDEQNNFYVFGGNGYDKDGNAGSLNDLWKWDGSNWTWLGGSNQINGMPIFGEKGLSNSSNWPAASRGPNTWQDANKDIFIFGGLGIDSVGASGYLNTLWRWDGQNWTWVGGDKTVDSEGVSSQLGVRNTTNWPSSRYFGSAEIDQNGQVLLTGGRSNNTTYNNDTWSWDGEEWAWIDGELNVNTNISYGTLNQPSQTNNPGSRYIHSSWINKENKLIIFGGYNIDNNGAFTRRNDQWAYQQEAVIGRSGKTIKPVFSVNSGTYTDSVLVSISSITPNSTIYFTTDGTIPNLNSSVYSSPITVRVNTTLTAIARGTTTLNSDTALATYTINYSKVEKPSFSPLGGTFQDSVRISLSTPNPSDAIYYTLNGSTPDTTSTKYVTPFLMRASKTVTAFATRDFAVDSDTSVANYTITYDRVPLPVFTPEGGTYNDSVRVSITSTIPDATIYYTTQEGGLTSTSPVYTSPIVLTGNTNIRAFATAPFKNPSQIASADYTIVNRSPEIAAPLPTQDTTQVISLFSEAFSNRPVDTWRTDWSQAIYEEVTINGNATKKYSNLDFVGIETVNNPIDASQMTHYRVDIWSANATQIRIKLVDMGPNGVLDGPGNGDDTEHELIFESPAQNQWIQYDLPLSDFVNLTNRAHIAQLIFAAGPAGQATVYLDNLYFYHDPNTPTQLAAAPTYNPAAGTYTDSVRVSLSSTTPNANIYYTLDGTAPDTNSRRFGQPFLLTDSTTVRAFATAPGFNPSSIAQAIYSIKNTPNAPTPIISPNGGTFIDSVRVGLNVELDGAAIYYTIDGTVPTNQSSLYTDSILVTSSITLSAITFVTDFNPSTINQASFIINETIPPPSLAMLKPAQNEILMLENDPNQLFEIEWEEISDTTQTGLISTWQLSTTSNFSDNDIIYSQNVVANTINTIELTYQKIASIANDAEISPGSVTFLYHRVQVSDGFRNTDGPTSSFILQRGTLTNTDNAELPFQNYLKQNYPNPFNPTTTIQYGLTTTSKVRLSIYSISGSLIEVLSDGVQSAGNYTVQYDASKLPSGVYFYQLQFDGFSQIMKMTLLK